MTLFKTILALLFIKTAYGNTFVCKSNELTATVHPSKYAATYEVSLSNGTELILSAGLPSTKSPKSGCFIEVKQTVQLFDMDFKNIGQFEQKHLWGMDNTRCVGGGYSSKTLTLNLEEGEFTLYCNNSSTLHPYF